MIIVVDGGRDSGIVVVPLAFGDLSVIVFVSEVLKELEEGLVFGDLAALHFWVLVDTVAWLQVASGYNA